MWMRDRGSSKNFNTRKRLEITNNGSFGSAKAFTQKIKQIVVRNLGKW
jgi:hypothetical protein